MILLYRELRFKRTRPLKRAVFLLIKNPLNSIFQEKRIYSLFFLAILLTLANALYLIGWPIIFKDILFIPTYYFGIISSIAGVFFLIGSLASKKFSSKKGTFKTLYFCLILIGIFYLIFALSKNIIFSLISFILIDFFNGGLSPLFYSLLNKFIPSAQRSTILSYYSLIVEGGAGIGEIIAGNLMIILTAPLVILLSPILIFISLTKFRKLKIE